jgi:hypothetical protein
MLCDSLLCLAILRISNLKNLTLIPAKEPIAIESVQWTPLYKESSSGEDLSREAVAAPSAVAKRLDSCSKIWLEADLAVDTASTTIVRDPSAISLRFQVSAASTVWISFRWPIFSRSGGSIALFDSSDLES